ncbi:MAG: chromosome partitioning protein ParA [Cellvibrionaceae bacterium]|nr:chromosome partitioning protein ParA [Cellvibrionaceae bacterium]|tara:strand:+ start:11763 stop:12395 length:633 start_codon:yes stop_codon:yes gene_type:complete
MKQVFVANPKGGCGKTTLATQLASYWAGQGMSVALMDHDRQQSSLDWLRSRPKDCAGIVPIAAFKGESADDQYEAVIHDMPAGCSVDDLDQWCGPGSQLVIPIMPSPTDIKAGVRFLMALNRHQWRQGNELDIALVANRVRTNTNYFKVLVAFLEQVNMPLITSIRDTQNYIRAMDNGVSIFDLPKSRVAADLKQWQPLLDWLEQSPAVS